MSVPVDRFTRAFIGTDRVPDATPTTSQSWLVQYARHVAWTDLSLISIAVLAGQFLRFGADPFRPIGRDGIPALLVTVTLIVGWQTALRVGQAGDPRILGTGPVEYHRVLSACFVCFGAWAIIDLAFALGIARGFIAIALPAGTLMLIVGRWAWRRHLLAGRESGRFLRSVLVVGSRSSARALIDRLNTNPALGYRVVGVCLTDPPGASPTPKFAAGHATQGVVAEVPIFAGYDRASELVRTCGANTVAVTSADALGHRAMRELSWELENCDVEMLVAPGLIDVAGPRITMRPEAGLPLLHIDRPRYKGANRFLKQTFDKVLTVVALVLLSPLLALCALAVKLDSRGPVFYRAERIGTDNTPFAMWKFRSMVVDADTMRAGLAVRDDGNGVLFKLHADPRVTRVGRIIRRYSLDELPQLFNVLGGTMSLVGPRPPLREEVESYDPVVRRRMLVRPGMTGLWQISGRSDLSWEDSVRLDLSYVENWSLTTDLVILWRTASAVLSRRGAY
ncbi:sugar transferase [Gordonia terrae]|uniref:Sugar transferase n=2 Tax=Gordonia terrae TaxID=2055 RepID=A0AAD0KBC2_9ACTN|nr:sugar transferase [Gordonia terrae]VTR06783.1 exopolysaccharide biosynthesis polyprenyl glycosylphosphotransferase [Clostridioides difficile]ANY22495.1 polyprenyl glycosylphosphotransferase [Gordonia terrae]AWO83232.1 sugar transferase [Gordonia terrae]VTS35743.1 Putative colanic biosynthesis UDP-glucose lipid carrier transferase [Gordonia terrae]GAB44502.1 putative glycosyltransferase [Gordonia terrae NBRC 100016]